MNDYFSSVAEAASALESIVSIIERNAISEKANAYCECFLSDGRRIALNNYNNQSAICGSIYSEIHFNAVKAFDSVPLFAVSYESIWAIELQDYMPSIKSDDARYMEPTLLKLAFDSFSSALIYECRDKSLPSQKISEFHSLLTDRRVITALGGTFSNTIDNIFLTEEYLGIFLNYKKTSRRIINSAGEKLAAITQIHNYFHEGGNVYYTSNKNKV